MKGDYKSSNKAFNKIKKILSIASESDEKEMFFLSIIDIANNATTLTNCCADMMRFNIHPNYARERLEKMIKTKKIDGVECHPIFISNAKLFLQEWDKGNIKRLK